MLNNNIKNRDFLIHSLERELVGPFPMGKELDCNTKSIVFDGNNEFFQNHVQKETGEEILKNNPIHRYKAGVLHPLYSQDNDEIDEEEFDPDLDQTDESTNQDQEIEEFPTTGQSNDDDDDDYLFQKKKQYSFGLSFLAEIDKDSEINIIFDGAIYKIQPVMIFSDSGIEGSSLTKPKNIYLRQPVQITGNIKNIWSDLIKTREISDNNIIINSTEKEIADIKFKCIIKSLPPNSTDSSKSRKIITISAVNMGISKESTIFQSKLTISVISKTSEYNILPYPTNTNTQDEDVETYKLLYRNFQTFAIGHGCSASWENQNSENKVRSVYSETIPITEIPSTSPDIKRQDGSDLEISMESLANKDYSSLEELIELYEIWISEKEKTNVGNTLDYVKNRHLAVCKEALERMKEGLLFINNDKDASKAFEFTNKAILYQQLSSDDKRIYNNNKFSTPYENPINKIKTNRGKWRPFQIAFLLSTIKSTVEPNDKNRETVDLLWFPTGGGKTEAYLGLAAFSIFHRRIKNPNDTGVQVLMRYTLRLLTSQQFERASALICAMEIIRKENPELGEKQFSIGIWIGSNVTPNRGDQALNLFNNLRRNTKDQENSSQSFLVSKCPWCNAEIGFIPGDKGTEPRGISVTRDKSIKAEQTIFYCPDPECPFYDPYGIEQMLPIYVVNEDVYKNKPDFIIATIDMFAQVSSNEKIRGIFGINESGNQEFTPPQLIIQDELHLISGPLGSMAGFYENLMEIFCTDERDSKTKPKIIASTATIREYKKQILDLYSRKESHLFPPPGLEINDSFFSKYITNDNGTYSYGKKYVGIYTTNAFSLQTAQSITLATILQSTMWIKKEERDPWWTVLAFFNSIRELSTTQTLLASDVAFHINNIYSRFKSVDDPDFRMRVIHPQELTSRINSNEINEVFDQLSQPYIPEEINQSKAKDICIATSIIEVGIDVDRLNVMVVTGRPKTTSQYIQATGRVGRQWQETPGLVISILNPSSMRDKSHYEKFRSFHENLYSNVEPTSVTPYTIPVLDKALKALLIGYVKQKGGKETISSPNTTQNPEILELMSELKNKMLDRLNYLPNDQYKLLATEFDKAIEEFKNHNRTEWGKMYTTIADENSITVKSSAFVPNNLENNKFPWKMPESLRNVDLSVRIDIPRED